MNWKYLWLLLPASFSLFAMDYEAETGKLFQGDIEAYQGSSGDKIVRFKGASRMDRSKIDPAKPDLEIPFKLDRAGTWKITGVVCTETTNNDSVHYRVDQGAWSSAMRSNPCRKSDGRAGRFSTVIVPAEKATIFRTSELQPYWRCRAHCQSNCHMGRNNPGGKGQTLPPPGIAH